MLKGFEDAFVDVQASVISLCLELLSNSGRTAEKIYVYLFKILYPIFDYPHEHYTFKHFEV